MRNLKIDVRQENGYSYLNAENNQGVTNYVMIAYIVCAWANKHSAFCGVHFFFLFDDFNLNTQGFIYLEFVKYQMGHPRNAQGFAKCNVCIAAIQLFYI